MYYIYMLRSESNPEKTYIGFTKDLKTRLSAHNLGQSPYTSKFKPWNLITYIAFNNRQKALDFERQKALDFEKYLKSHSGKAFAKKRLWA